MKWLLLCLLFTLAACVAPGGQYPQVDIGKVVSDTVAAVDRNRDGAVTNSELKDSKNDPMTWIAIATSLLGLFGVGAVNAKTNRVERNTDELWDRAAPPTQ
jgi:hypothetical protein